MRTHARTAQDTEDLGWRLESARPAADAALAVLYLSGELGAGKTTFARHLLAALGVTGHVKSPTYAVMEPYELVRDGAPFSVWHFDFYRFNDPQEWEDAGFRDVFASVGLKIAEWPEKAEGLLPVADLRVDIEPLSDDNREVRLTAQTALGRELLA